LLANPNDAGSWFRGQLKCHGIPVREVIVSPPRREAELCLFQMSAISEEELASMIRLLGETRSGVSVDSLHLDILPQPMPVSALMTRALIVVFPGSSLSVIQAVIRVSD